MPWEKCCNCKVDFWMPDDLYAAAQRDRGPNGISFYCPHGHGQHYAIGETEETKLRRERDRLAQQIAERDDRIKSLRDSNDHIERRLNATRGVVTRIKNRVGHGVCPCCNRTFGDLARHMAHKHPTYSAEAAE